MRRWHVASNVSCCSLCSSIFYSLSAGFGTDELLLTCCLIRFQHVMTQVMGHHIEMYGKTIHERVRSEVGGKYKALLLQVLNTVWPEEG